MDCTEAYKEHIMYSFNGFCKVVIRYAAINAWRDRNRRRQREISFLSIRYVLHGGYLLLAAAFNSDTASFH